jgi:uncharacterized metal-binding protein YceD (DUF177 family)
VNSQDRYIIPFRGLKPGVHPFEFEVGDTFFDLFPESQIRKGAVSIHVNLEKEERMLIFDLTLDGSAEVPCDRCDAPLNIRIAGTERLIVKFGETWQEQSDEVLIIPEMSHQFDLAPFIYEYVHLLLPMRKVHGEEGTDGSQCDPEVIRKLEELNSKTETDPRWEALSKLKEKN